MSDPKKPSQPPPPTIITLTLPTPDGGGITPERATATLLIQRGDLAHVRQFHYSGCLPDVMDAIREATEALGLLEEKPPIIPDLPATTAKPEAAPKTKAKTADRPAPDDEPTIDIPLRKGTLAVKISHLKIVGGETDAAAYRQAVLIAGKLVDGKLWDGQSPIRISDVHAVAKKMQHLSDRELSLFTLEDFVMVAGAADVPETIQTSDQAVVAAAGNGAEAGSPLLTAAPSLDGKTFSANGHHPHTED